jgi:hypothetical protein
VGHLWETRLDAMSQSWMRETTPSDDLRKDIVADSITEEDRIVA